jgi:hypothetical protein
MGPVLMTVEILQVTQKDTAVKTFNAPRFEALPHLRFSSNDPKSLISVLKFHCSSDFPQFSVQFHSPQRNRKGEFHCIMNIYVCNKVIIPLLITTKTWEDTVM